MSLRYGDKGEAVKTLQTYLNKKGFYNQHQQPLIIDGYFGEDTQYAVLQFQQKMGLTADGIVGIKTQQLLYLQPLSPINHHQMPLHLTDRDYQYAAQRLGVSELTIRVFGAVESNGQGFLKNGKPKILFERHRMYRYLTQKFGDSFAQQKMQYYPHIVNTATGGYQGGAAEYDRLDLAKTIDEESALQSTSWGQFQVMGENWKFLGYSSVQQFVKEQYESESKQLEAFIRFIERKTGVVDGQTIALHEALKQHHWHDVFTLYNGTNYQKLGYQDKFQQHWERLSSIYGKK